ncbi:MAG: hypothetical protein CMJ18_09055 [Phycisphaeraceae bacterium]|nr:hypothetical protein [Phycisphaeraceae bacterium]
MDDTETQDDQAPTPPPTDSVDAPATDGDAGDDAASEAGEEPSTVEADRSDPVIERIGRDLLRYHRKNALRVAWATPLLTAQHDGELIDRAYGVLADDELVEPVFHTVQRNGRTWQCYRVTKKGLSDGS